MCRVGSSGRQVHGAQLGLSHNTPTPAQRTALRGVRTFSWAGACAVRFQIRVGRV